MLALTVAPPWFIFMLRCVCVCVCVCVYMCVSAGMCIKMCACVCVCVCVYVCTCVYLICSVGGHLLFQLHHDVSEQHIVVRDFGHLQRWWCPIELYK
jgi:hypothetical protein